MMPRRPHPDGTARGAAASLADRAAVPKPALPATASEGGALGYIPAIDGLRAIAILSVVVYHLRPNRLPGGFVGVDLFFVVSGFVVTASLAHLRFEPLSTLLAYFYARRIVRIAPALVLMLLAATLASVLFITLPSRPGSPWSPHGGRRRQQHRARPARPGLFLSRVGAQPFLHTWTLGVEEQFYLLFPVFLFLCQGFLANRRRALLGTALIALLSALSLLLAWRLSRRIRCSPSS